MEELVEKLSDLESEMMKLRKEVETQINVKDGIVSGGVDALSVSHRLYAIEMGIHSAWKLLKESPESAG